MHSVVTAAGDLVQSTKCEPTSEQTPIDCVEPERERAVDSASLRFDMTDLAASIFKGKRGVRRHRLGEPAASLFYICSHDGQ